MRASNDEFRTEISTASRFGGIEVGNRYAQHGWLRATNSAEEETEGGKRGGGIWKLSNGETRRGV